MQKWNTPFSTVFKNNTNYLNNSIKACFYYNLYTHGAEACPTVGHIPLMNQIRRDVHMPTLNYAPNEIRSCQMKHLATPLIMLY